MDLGLKGKRALVMASSRGLGLGIAQVLAEEGAEVLLSGRSADRLAAQAGAGGDAKLLRCRSHVSLLCYGVDRSRLP